MKYFLIILFFSLSSISVCGQSSSDKLIRQGVSLHDKGRYKDAIECYKQALEMNPSSMSAVYEMSLSYLQLRDYDNALKYSNKVISSNFQPLLVDAYVVKSTALAESGKVDQSIQLLNEALVRCGDEYLLYFNLGLSYFNKKENLLAISHLRKAIEIDATRSSAFLLYAYALSDTDRWIQSFYAFHFFLLLEPNTERSRDAFDEMYTLLTTKLLNGSGSAFEDGVDRNILASALKRIPAAGSDATSQYKYFLESSKTIFFLLGQMQNDTQNGLLWNFFVPVYNELLGSGHFDTYCRYVSVSYFPESLEWWNNNKEQVDNFIDWFENGQGTENDESELGDDSDIDEVLPQ